MSGPLRGARVGVTRSRSQASRLAELLSRAGAEPVELPCLELVDPVSFAPLDEALATLPSGFDGVLFTSTNSVERVLARTPPERFVGLEIGVTGRTTAAALESRGVNVTVLPERFLSEGLLAALDSSLGDRLDGFRWLLPRAEEAREVLPAGLRARGCAVQVVTAYRAVPPNDPEPLRRALESGLHAVTFASGATARHLAGALARPLSEALDGVAVASIGPVTSRACAELGLSVTVEAEEASMQALVEALVAWWGSRA